MRRAAGSGAGDKDYTKRALEEYRAEYGVPFTLLHAWKFLQDCPKWKDAEVSNFEQDRQEKNKRYKSLGSSSFNIVQSGEGSFNLNVEAGDKEEEEVYKVRRPMGRDRANKKAKHHRHRLQQLTLTTCWLGLWSLDTQKKTRRFY